MSSESARCLPTVTGLAAEVNQLLQQYEVPRNRPQRYPVPTEPGVYRLTQPGLEELGDEMAQLTEEGQWWPYPFVFSGWRTSEISLFETTPLPERTMDVPEIPNPELRHAIDAFAAELSKAFPSLDAAEVYEFSKRHTEQRYL